MSRKNYWANTFATPIEDTPEHKERVKGKPYLGFVNKNHSSTIVKGKDFYNAGGSVARRLKTSSSKRVCLISKSLSDEIKHHIEENHLKNKDYLFFSSQRKNYPLSKHAIENNLKHASDLAKIEGVHFHLFRHSAATVLYQSGFNSMSIKNFLGHSSDATTKKYYIHDDEKTPQEMADKMYEMLSKCYQK